MATQTHDGRSIRLMTLIDEHIRECTTIRVARRINSFGVIEVLADVMLYRGIPEHIRSDNGPGMTAKVVVEQWRKYCSTKRPHSALGYRAPAPVTYSSVPMPLEQPATVQ